MNRRLAGWALVLVPVLIAGCTTQQAVAPAQHGKSFEQSPSYEVVRVIDGDTVVLLMKGKETKVRLIGVDTPETVHPSKPVEAYGREASRFTKNLLKGESVYIEYEAGPSKVDRYGRLLAYLYRAPDGLFVNIEIVRQGYGHAYTKYPFKYMEMFRDCERKARETEKGLWAPEVSPEGASAPTTLGPSERTGNAPTVYITKTGAKYHVEGCRYSTQSSIPMSLEEAQKRGLTACSVCKP